MKKLLVLLFALVLAPSVYANVSGSQGFAAPALVQADASPTGNINTATMFDLVGWSTTNNSVGIFAGLPIQNFGHVLLTLGAGGKLDFGDATFGTFSSSSITTSSSGPGFLDVLAFGTFAPGTIAPGSPALSSETRIALTQTPPMDGEISASGTMSITPTPVPEDATFILFGTGLLLALVVVPRLRAKLLL